jgi:hypothetical protein
VLDVLTLEGDKIAAVTGFLMPEDPAAAEPATAIFARFGLPAVLP